MAATVFIGAGAGFAGDRTDAAGPVAEALAACPGPRFLMFETLAERTLALSQLDRHRDPRRGFNPALDRFVGPVLDRCLREEIRIVGNFGAANPAAHFIPNGPPTMKTAGELALIQFADYQARRGTTPPCRWPSGSSSPKASRATWC